MGKLFVRHDTGDTDTGRPTLDDDVDDARIGPGLLGAECHHQTDQADECTRIGDMHADDDEAGEDRDTDDADCDWIKQHQMSSFRAR